MNALLNRDESMKRRVLSILLLGLAVVPLWAQEARKTYSREEQSAFIERASQLLKENYVFLDAAQRMEEALKSKLAAGDFDKAADLEAFAGAVTQELQLVSRDKHLWIYAKRRPAEAAGGGMNPLLREYENARLWKESNFGFTRVEKLRGSNIGVLAMIGFSELPFGKKAADAAMDMLAASDAVIIDLRDNGGGYPDMVWYLSGYLFDKPVHLSSLYFRNTDRTTEYYSAAKVDGKKIADLPLFLLTSSKTFSGAEEFAYGLQAQKRAIVIGETTGGGAHLTRAYPVNDDFIIDIPYGRSINPITKSNWEGVGVKPDIEIEASRAFDAALAIAKEAAQARRKARLEAARSFLGDLEKNLEGIEKLFEDGQEGDAARLANSLLDQGVAKEALNETIINQLGYQVLEKKNYPLSIEIFKYNIKAFPHSANAFDSLGEAYLKASRRELAIQNYEMALKLNPDSQSAKDALNSLRQKH